MSGNPYDGFGGGLNNANGTVTLNNSTMSNNHSSAFGGGISSFATSGNTASINLMNGTVSGNTSREGSGISENSYAGGTGTVMIDGTTISNNNASQSGGGMTFVPLSGSTTNVTITNATISDNTASIGGGAGIQSPNAGTTLSIVGSTISGNQATGGGGSTHGGGLNVRNATLTQSTISGNTTTGNGGGLHVIGVATVTDSTFTGNSANYGGAIRGTTTGLDLTITNTTISGNSTTNATYGMAGVYLSNGSATLVNTTITGNTTTGAGDGNGLYLYSSPTVTMTNSIVTNNQNAECVSAGTFTGSNNLVDDATCTGNLGMVTNFNGTLAGNGGDTQTHAITLASNAVDAGDTTACTNEGITQDQRNTVNRITCDIGAYEAGDLVCGIQAAGEPASYPRPNNMAFNVTDDGTDLDCISVIEVAGDHPEAGGVSNLETGTYWSIQGLQSDLTTAATTDFSVDVTLPHNITPSTDAKVCRYSGGWTCANDSNTASTVTANGFNAFSDWTVGEDVGPTSVTMQGSSTTDNGTLWIWLTTVVGGLLGATWFATRLRKEN